MAFAHSAIPFLRRLRPSSHRSTWICSTFPAGQHAGRGAWDLDRNSARPLTDRSFSKARPRSNDYSEYDQRGRRERSNREDKYTSKRGERVSYSESFGPRRGRERREQNVRPWDERRGERYQGRRNWTREWESVDSYEENAFNESGRRAGRGERRGRQQQVNHWDQDDDHEVDRNWNGSEGQANWSRRSSEEPSVVQRALAATEDDLLYGINPVLLALLSTRRERFVRLYVQNRTEGGGVARKTGNEAAYEKVMGLASGKKIPMVKLSKGELNALSENRPHQGLVLQTSQMEYEDMKGLPVVEEGSLNTRGAPWCYLVLDEVSDPQNAGALIRSAHFLGADGVIVCKRNSCRLSPVVSKASAGALEVMNVLGVGSMPRFLKAARRDGWRVVGTALGDDTVSLKGVSLDCPTLVVMGSEGHGLRTLVKQECDLLVKIGGNGGGVAAELGLHSEPVDSLNVSVAGALALFQLLGQ